MIQPFRSLLAEALREFAATGYTSEAALQDWLIRLRTAIEREMPPDTQTRKELAAVLGRIFARDVRGIAKRVPGVERYTLDRVAPSLRAELDRRIFAGVDLIRLNRRAAVDKTLQRFSGWVSSTPPQSLLRKGGRGIRDAAKEIAKPVAQVRYEKRRVAIDQGHKLSAAVAHVVAMGSGAIAGVWHDRGEHDHGYDARPEHLKRTGKMFLVRNSWAMDEGLVKKGGLDYYDDLEDQVAQLPFCSCYMTWITSPREIPEKLLTAKGRAWLAS